MADCSAVYSVGNSDPRLAEMTAGPLAAKTAGNSALRKVVTMAAAMVVDWVAKKVDYSAARSVDNSDDSLDDLKVVGKAVRSEAKMVEYSVARSVGNSDPRLAEMTAGMWAAKTAGNSALRKVVKMAAAMVVDWVA